jgi:hypothetical protein
MGASSLPPGLQLALERLLGLFVRYVSARNDGERQQLQAEIAEIFSALGVVPELPSVSEAIQLFERIKREPAAPKLRRTTLADEARDFVNSRLRVLENSGDNPALSAGARELLRVPVAEAARFSGHFETEEIATSLDALFSTLREPPSSPSEGTTEVRTSVAVIRAFWKNFCNIPPFCSGRPT